MNIAQTSPLYEYWNSEQDENDEKKRLLKLNPKEPASNLFSSEPYKWENLYQSVLRNVIDGDESSLKGLMVLNKFFGFVNLPPMKCPNWPL